MIVGDDKDECMMAEVVRCCWVRVERRIRLPC